MYVCVCVRGCVSRVLCVASVPLWPEVLVCTQHTFYDDCRLPRRHRHLPVRGCASAEASVAQSVSNDIDWGDAVDEVKGYAVSLLC